jgi:hypothetical protein
LYGKIIAELPYRFAVVGAATGFFASLRSDLGTALVRALVCCVAFWIGGLVVGALAALQATQE